MSGEPHSQQRTVVASLGVAFISILVVLACGRVDEGSRSADAATTTPTSTATSPDPSFPPPVDLPLEAAVRDAAHPDGGPAPMTACADASPELRCPLPASFCLDDHWMRYYANPQCDESTGQCQFTALDMECLSGGVPPDCFMGGCRQVLVR